MSAKFIVADVFDGLAQLDDDSVDLVVTSPPFLALRSYLPAEHPDKGKEIGSEPTPAAFLDVLLAVTAELRRVLAPHGSIAIELGDTYSGSGGSGGDYNENGLRAGQAKFEGSGRRALAKSKDRWAKSDKRPGWPLAKSKTLVPELFRIALAYGVNPLTGQESPAGQWRVRNVVTWARPNPPVGALGDKWRPATSDVVVACLSKDRYWDDLATRKPSDYHRESLYTNTNTPPGQRPNMSQHTVNSGGAPLLDWWEIPPGGYKGAHYAVYPPELVAPLVKAMCPKRVCRTCGEPSRPILSDPTYERTDTDRVPARLTMQDGERPAEGVNQHLRADGANTSVIARRTVESWTDCGHDTWRTGVVLDPFVGSGTTLQVAAGHGFDAIGIDLDERNLDLARERVGMFLEEPV